MPHNKPLNQTGRWPSLERSPPRKFRTRIERKARLPSSGVDFDLLDSPTPAIPAGYGPIRYTAWANALLEFWFEFASTYSYPAAARVREACADANVEVAWRPFLLGPLFVRMGWNDSPFNIYPAKGAYMWRDLERICADMEVPWTKPSSFPRNGLLAARVAHSAESESWIGDFVVSIYEANFSEDLDISDPNVVAARIEAVGGDPDEMLNRASSEGTKNGLRDRTNFAQELGVFGAPTFVVDRELFWGNDRLEQAIRRAVRRAV